MRLTFDNPEILLTGYCVLAFLAAWAGGTLPSLLKLTHTGLQIAVSLVAGIMVGLSLLGLLPHAMEHLATAPDATAWALAGFLAMFFLQRFLPFHHHDVAEGSPLEPCGHAHSLAERSARNLNWFGVAVGLSIHSIFDGLAMATATATPTASQHGVGFLGLGTAMAVILHKPFGALAIGTLLEAQGSGKSFRRWVILVFASITPLGAMAFFLGAAPWAESHPHGLGSALGFCAGTFLCIACADLLPELQFHSHDRWKMSGALIAGVAIAWSLVHFAH